MLISSIFVCQKIQHLLKQSAKIRIQTAQCGVSEFEWNL